MPWLKSTLAIPDNSSPLHSTASKQ